MTLFFILSLQWLTHEPAGSTGPVITEKPALNHPRTSPSPLVWSRGAHGGPVILRADTGRRFKMISSWLRCYGDKTKFPQIQMSEQIPGPAFALWSTATCGELLSVDHRSPVTSGYTKQTSMPPGGPGTWGQTRCQPRKKASAKEALAFWTCASRGFTDKNQPFNQSISSFSFSSDRQQVHTL